MLFMSLGSVFAITSLSLLAIGGLIVAFVVVADHHQVTAQGHDCEREIQRITMKVRHPWQHRAAVAGRWLMRDVR